MKRSILIYILALLGFTGNTATLKWNGASGDEQWSNPLNWEAGVVPGPADDVILDNTYLAGSYTVLLPAGNVQVSILSLTIIPAAAYITCILPSTNTASQALQLTRTGDAFILHNGAVFRNASGATSGTPVTVTADGIFRINNGGHYLHQTLRGHTDFLVSRLSTAPGTEEGIFEFDVPGTAAYTISVSGRVFGKLVFSAASAGGARTYTGAGINPVLIRGGMEIKENVIFSYGANTDTITITGRAVIRQNAVFNIANGSNSGVVCFKGDLDNDGLITETGSSPGATIVFNGAVPQQVSCTGNIIQQVKVLIDNPSGITLASPLMISYGLQFLRGKLFTTSANLLSFGESALSTGASSEGFVQGPVKKTGTAAFEFPVGTGTIYAPVGISEGGSTADEFVAEYKRANPRSVPGLGSTCQSPINHISYVEYWTLSQITGTASRQVKLSVSPYSFAYDFGALVVARSENGQWVSEGSADQAPGTPQGSYVTGSFYSTTTVGAFGAFTLGSLIDQQQNPLPLMLEYFRAKASGDHIRLEWRTGVCSEEKLRSVLEYAGADKLFRSLATLYGNDADCSFTYRHFYADQYPRYYRLSLVDLSGNIVYQQTLLTPGQNNPKEHYLRIVKDDRSQLNILASMPAGKASLIIIDNTGRLLYRKDHLFSGHEERLTIPFSSVASGIYRLIAFTSTGKLCLSFIH